MEVECEREARSLGARRSAQRSYERPTIALRARIQLPPSLPIVRRPRRLPANRLPVPELLGRWLPRSRITRTGASRRPINLLRSSKPGACSQAKSTLSTWIDLRAGRCQAIKLSKTKKKLPSTVWQFSTRKGRGKKIIERKINFAGLFLTTYAVIGIHRVIFVMEIRTSSIDECNFRICTAVSVFWLNSMRYCGFCTFFCAVLRLSDPLYTPLY